ncbi:WXG100 family type VII secretion target [Mycobacterium sp. PDNC021]|uniref:WXG100 family type VII secretion target n=1 Tax=Mycobacterium sp. PDNC021 TaxID=3391399 RepID=UPI003AB06998
MNTDAAVLASEAANFNRIHGELTTHKTGVDSTAHELQASMVGEAGSATTVALARFDEAMQQQLKELEDISSNIQSAGTQYTAADGDAASSLASQMRI